MNLVLEKSPRSVEVRNFDDSVTERDIKKIGSTGI